MRGDRQRRCDTASQAVEQPVRARCRSNGPKSRLGLRCWLLVFITIGGCRDDRAVTVNVDPDDRERGELSTAVEAFVQSGRTPDAYRAFAETIASMRARMSTTVVREAELRLVTLAIAPVESVRDAPLPEQARALGLTVWPHLLGPPLTSTRTDTRNLIPRHGESLDHYLDRVCSEIVECAQSHPEERLSVISRTVAETAVVRTTDALRSCAGCREPEWHAIKRRWEAVLWSTTSTSRGSRVRH